MKIKLGSRAQALAGAATVVLAAVALPLAAQDRLRVLVVNDDGIGATGLQALVTELAIVADVVVCAPDKDRSWAGRSKTIPSGMLRLREAKIAGATEAYAIEGTPVDAVRFGLGALGAETPFDAVIAGVNFGVTLGAEAYSTGVVGAALEAASMGVPAIAVAQDRRAHVFDVAGSVTRQLLENWLEVGLAEGVALSVNIPASAADRPRGIVAARLGDSEYAISGFRKVERDDAGSEARRQMWRIQFKKVRRPERETDLDWYQRGEIIVTPLNANGSATDLVGQIDGWGLQTPTRAPSE